jgi:hypothetical protein
MNLELHLEINLSLDYIGRTITSWDTQEEFFKEIRQFIIDRFDGQVKNGKIEFLIIITSNRY